MAIYTILNPADIVETTLSNGNLTFTSTGTAALARAYDGYSSGKYYFEINAIGGTSSIAFGPGVCTKTATAANIQANATNGSALAVISGSSAEYWLNGTNEGTAVQSTTTAQAAVDLTDGLVWFRNGNSGGWNANGSASPFTGVGGFSLAAFSGVKLFPCAFASTTGQTVTFNFGQSAFTGSVPPGYTAGWPSTMLGQGNFLNAGMF